MLVISLNMAYTKMLVFALLAIIVTAEVALAQDKQVEDNKTDVNTNTKPEDSSQKEASQDKPASEATTQKKVEVSASNVTTTTPAPITPTDLVCKSCSCHEETSTVDCHDKQLTEFFSIADWAGLSKMAPKIVDLSQNDFKRVTPFTQLPLESLNLSSCGIESIELASFKMLQKMRVLDLSHNKLTYEALKPDIFEGTYYAEKYEPLSSMRILNLSYNDLHSLHQDVFEHLEQLEELILKGNPFKIIDHVTVVAISSLPYIKALDMSDCNLKELPENFLHTPRQMERLDLSNNLFETVPQELEEAVALTYLNLNNNPIRYIVAEDDLYTAFPSIPSLKELHMTGMPVLEEIRNHGLSGLSGLEILYITNNLALSFIEPLMLAKKNVAGESWDYPMLKELHLRSNNLTTIQADLVGRWDKMSLIDIRFNPFLCDCSNQWMVDTLIPLILETSPNRTTDIICREPIEMRGKSIVHLEEVHRHMRCLDRYGHRPERDGAMLIGTVIGVLLAVPICLTILLLYKRGYFAFIGIRGPAEVSRAFYKRAQTDDFSF